MSRVGSLFSGYGGLELAIASVIVPQQAAHALDLLLGAA